MAACWNVHPRRVESAECWVPLVVFPLCFEFELVPRVGRFM
jgi:hypothetical protein